MSAHLHDHNYCRRPPSTRPGAGRRRRRREESLLGGSEELPARRSRGRDSPAVRPGPQSSSAPRATAAGQASASAPRSGGLAGNLRAPSVPAFLSSYDFDVVSEILLAWLVHSVYDPEM
ncbi:uncharacterized protein V6R79_015161 [Siganus canaliculatus]